MKEAPPINETVEGEGTSSTSQTAHRSIHKPFEIPGGTLKLQYAIL